MPRLAGGTASTRSPSISTSPPDESSSPAMMRSKVDLPQPGGRTKITHSPSGTSRSMPCSALVVPKLLVTDLSCREPTGRLLEFDRKAGSHALVRRKADAERSDGVVHVAGEVDILGDSAVDIVLFAGAERIVARLPGHRQ